MDVPSSDAGTIVSVAVKVGDKVSQGDVIGRIKTSALRPAAASAPAAASEPTVSAPAPAAPAATAAKSAPSNRTAPVPEHPQMKKKSSGGVVHASPAVRRFARELGADLSKVKGSGPKGRILER